jgi:hypothetical protein
LIAEVRNTHLMPTRSAIQQRERIGRVDLWMLDASAPGPNIVAAVKVDGWYDLFARPLGHKPRRVQMPEGVPGRDARLVCWFVQGPEGASVKMGCSAERAGKIERTIELCECERR